MRYSFDFSLINFVFVIFFIVVGFEYRIHIRIFEIIFERIFESGIDMFKSGNLQSTRLDGTESFQSLKPVQVPPYAYVCLVS